ncbi:MAG TPA: ribokinase [Acidobacteriaceae bacterium]|nr:ribokinase [Terriglobia bacterium]HVC89305.1 ribokinase [Acidobacteriaceae bacterium]
MNRSKTMRPIVVVGSINMDLVSTVSRIPAGGETLLGSGFQMYSGGKGANQAVAVARLSYPVEMIGKLGSDLFGERLRAQLQSAGVGMAGVETVEGSSGIAAITVAATGENSIVVTQGANAAVSPLYVEQHRSLIRSAGLVLAQLEIPIESVERLAELCFQERVPLMLDPAPAQALPPSLLRRIRWLTPNETEADFYVGRVADDLGQGSVDARVLRETARSLLAQGPGGIILKLGPRGAYLAADGVEQLLHAMPVEAVDTTAAGDALNGAFAVGLMLGKSALESARFAVAAASVSVTRAGAQPSMPTFAEVSRMLDGGR